MFMLRINPNNVNQMPFFLGCVLINLRMKIGAINMAMSINGTSLLNLVNMNIPKPRMKYIVEAYFLEIILKTIKNN
jgi:hypothetical protein